MAQKRNVKPTRGVGTPDDGFEDARESLEKPDDPWANHELVQIVLKSPRKRYHTKRTYLRGIRDYLAYSRGVLEGPMVESWRDMMIHRGLAARSVNTYLSGLQWASARLADRHRDPSLDFARYAEQLKVDEGPKNRLPLTHLQAAALLATTDDGPSLGVPHDLRDRAIILLGLKTGLRRYGIVNIDREDWLSSHLTVTLKGGRRHTIVLDQEVVDALGAWTKWLDRQGVRDGAMFRGLRHELDAEGKDHYVITDRYTSDGLYKQLKTRAKRVGLDFFPHLFRHTFVTWCQQAGVPAYRITAITGHRTDGILDTYTTDMEAETRPVGSLLPSLTRPTETR